MRHGSYMGESVKEKCLVSDRVEGVKGSTGEVEWGFSITRVL